RYIKRALKSRNVEIFEYQLEIEGELHDYECHMNAIDDRCVIALVRDITERRLEAEKLPKLVESAPDPQERKRVYEELRTTREYLDTILLNMPAGLAILEGPEFKYSRINQELADINGVPVEEHLGRPLAEVLPQAAKDIVPVLQKVLDTGESTPRREFSTRLPKDPDEIRHFIDSFFPIKGQDGEVKAVGAVVLDIGERKRAEEILASQEKLYRTLIESIPHVIWLGSADGQVTFLNKAWQEWTGRDIEESLGSKWAESVHPEDAPGLLAKWERAYKHGEPYNGECRFKAKDGSYKTITFIGTPVRDESGKITSWAGIDIDITERKQAEEALRQANDELERRVEERTEELQKALDRLGKEIEESEQARTALVESEKRLSHILESAMDAIITINDARRIVLFNEAAETVFRCPAAEAIGKPIDRFLSESFGNLLTRDLQDFGKHKITKQYMSAPGGLTAMRANGEEFPIEATISQVEVSGKRLYTIILRDIEERKQAEAELNKLQLEKDYLQEEIKTEYNFREVIGASAAMRKVFQNIEKVATTDSTVLLTGETGAGKELLARLVHNLSNRKDKVMVKVNCTALPAGLVESELFGHEKGAFTGATTKKKGRFELADGGTIFLDEIGELPLETQTKLLRVLQEQEFERVGGTETQKVNVRVIAASNRNLEEDVKHGAFRADLFYRLNIFPIHIPPLRERIDDMPLLINYFIKKFSHRMGKRIQSISPQAQEKLMSYDWPGNVRELANILERAVILCEGRLLQQEHIGISIQHPTREAEISTLEEVERMHIQKALEKTAGVVGGPHGAATLLGMKRTTLIDRMRKLGIYKNATV
ncbi:sigma 54-interacting transcriptional regulator, partial [candidate division KSB1 bacterium]|nr:sigma 54-interacting transcriptional regulator [candidate division KSB1 bacterium]